MTIWQARLLDLRVYIALMFLIFGTIVTISGIFATPAEITKAAGININLWSGLSMLVLAVVFGTWLFLSPPEVPEPTDEIDPDAAVETPSNVHST